MPHWKEGVDSRRAESAAEHVVTRALTAHRDERVETVVGRLIHQRFDSLEAVYVIGRDHGFEGAVRLADLLAAPVGRRVGDLVDSEYPRVGPHHDQEHVAAEALEHRATSVAVIDDKGRFVGAVPALPLLDILRREHVEDLHRLAGVEREVARGRVALETPPARRARHRLPWLLVGLGGSMLAAVFVSRFEDLLKTNVAIAYFVPTIVYLADAIGTQTEAIVVRGLSLSRLSLRHLLADELRTGVLIGATLAALSFPLVALVFGSVPLAVCVATAILVAGGVATTVGLLLPWCFHHLGSDPALGSGPVATIVQDVLSLLIYFWIASLVAG